MIPFSQSLKSCWTENRVSFTPDVKSNTFAFIFFTAFGTQTRAYGLLMVLELPPDLLTLTVNR